MIQLIKIYLFKNMATLKKIGGGWIKTSKSGVTYISATIEDDKGNKTNINIFKNTKKEKENQPDYNFTIDTEKYPQYAEKKEEKPEIKPEYNFSRDNVNTSLDPDIKDINIETLPF